MTTRVRSSWISTVSYLPLPTPGNGWVAFFLHPKPRVNGCDDGPSAILYGPDLPSWLPGLVTAGLGGKSVGQAYHKLVRGKYVGQTIKGQEKVDELKRLMKGQSVVPYRWAYLDFDARRQPKTDLFCSVCQKDIKRTSNYRMIHIIEGGGKVLHPGDERLYNDPQADLGWHPIGPDCAKKLGLEWSVPA